MRRGYMYIGEITALGKLFSLEIDYCVVQPKEEQTFDHPGVDPELEIQVVRLDGEAVDLDEITQDEHKELERRIYNHYEQPSDD